MIRYCYFVVVDDTDEKEVIQEAIDYINGNYEDTKIINVEREKCNIRVRNNVIKSKGKITFEHN